MDVTDAIYKSIGEPYKYVGGLLDLAKPFDTVDRALFLRKLGGVKDISLNLLKSYLSKTSDHEQKSHLESYGVPPGTVLDRVLFWEPSEVACIKEIALIVHLHVTLILWNM